jgi:glyoxylase-like metal-dependent hydrolase (beta-lactamase superfamily II)
MRLVLASLLIAIGASGCAGGQPGSSVGGEERASVTSRGYEAHRFVLGALEENAYLLVDARTKKGLIVDPGERSGKLESVVSSEDVRIVGVVNTHGHYDHIGANAYYAKRYGVDVYASAADFGLYHSQSGVDPANAPTKAFPARGDLDVRGLHVRVIPTPGHTQGSVCLLAGNFLFSGDTLFEGDVGRTDGDTAATQLVSSIERELMPLPTDTVVFPGHADATTIGRERDGNSYLHGR